MTKKEKTKMRQALLARRVVLTMRKAVSGKILTWKEGRCKMKDATFTEFKEKFSRTFSKEELREIETEVWQDSCRNAGILGIFDRKFRGKGVRDELIKWLDSHPDDFTKRMEEEFGKKPSAREFAV